MADQSSQPILNGATSNPKQIPPPATYTPARWSRRRRSPICRCLGCIFAVQFVIVLILGIAALIIFLVVHPKSPRYHVLDASVSQLNVSVTPNPQLSYDVFAFTWQAYNPNKKIGISYDDIQVFLFFDVWQIGQSSIAPFSQGHKNITDFEIDLRGQNIALQQTTAAILQADIGSQFGIPFQLLVKMRAKMKLGIWKSPRFKLRNTCSVIISPPNSTLSAHLLSSSCKTKWKL